MKDSRRTPATIGHQGRRLAPRRIRARRAALLITTLALVGGAIASPPADAADVTIVDTLGVVSPSTTFSLFGSGGQSVFGSQLVGPRFTLTEPALITEIGAFTNNCEAVIAGVPQCPGTQPFVAQIRPSLNGAPDASRIVATIVLSHDDLPLVVSYESATPNLVLDAGTYFALFAPQGADAGFLLSSASVPFAYQAGLAPFGFLDPTTALAFASDQFGAVRIIGRALTASEQIDSLGVAVAGVGPGTSLANKVAAARASLAAGEVGETCEILGAFRNEVTAQSGKSIVQATAAELLDSATRIRSVLAC